MVNDEGITNYELRITNYEKPPGLSRCLWVESFLI